jgi:hypothetical protein
MQENRSPRRRDQSSGCPTEHEDAILERAVLALVLSQHPAQFTVAELTRELSDDPEHPTQRDAVQRALRDLVGSGLLHRHGAFVLPTRAALRFDRLAVN